MGIFNTSLSSFLKDSNDKQQTVLEYLMALILITLPLKNIFVSIATISLVVMSVFLKKSQGFNFKRTFLIPILFFGIMIMSLLWTKNYNDTLLGIQKALSFLVIPIVFFLIPKLSKETLNNIFRIYGFGMVFYAIFYIVMASMGYAKTNNTNIFFNNNLVPVDPGAIYMSVFASFALFYFIQIENKKNIEKVALSILTVFIFLLSSKSIITVDFIIIVWFYAFYAKIHNGTKALTISAVSLFLFFSIFFVKEVKDRFLVEYETAFVDNISQGKLNKQPEKNHNVSIKEAWTNAKFQQTDFFPGTALRVYQARIFKEMLQEEPLFLKGFGLEASQYRIREKAKEHNLFYDYGEYNFHNQYIQSFAELGLFGVLLLVIMLFVNLNNGLLKKDFLHIAFGITMIILFLSESFFCRQRGIVFFITIYCMFNNVKPILVKPNLL
jgi:O-antigen ligase